MAKIPFDEKNIAVIDDYADHCLERGYSTTKIDRTKIQTSLIALYAILGLTTPNIVFVDGPMAAINKAVEIGDKRPKQDIRYDLFVANWRGYWFRRYGGGAKLDPQIFDKDQEELDHWLLLADEGHAYLMYEECVIVTERPEFISVDSEGRLHHESRAALRERDGVEIYAWHGVEVPQAIILAPETITIQAIDSEPNQEIKRVMLERFTVQRYLIEGKAESVDSDKDSLGQPRTLYRKPIVGTQTTLYILHVKNSTPEPDGSIKDYFLEIHPECRPMWRDDKGEMQLGEAQKMTCRNAVASTFGLSGQEYAPLVET